MSGYWVTLYKDFDEREVAGYLYCCSVEKCNNVIRVISKTEKEKCPKCGEPVIEIS